MSQLKFEELLLFTNEILCEISNYFENFKDYLHLAQINKNFYNSLILKNSIAFQKIVKRTVGIILNKNLPIYLFKTESVMLKGLNHDFNLLQNFTNIKYLNFYKIPQEFLNTMTAFRCLQNLEELHLRDKDSIPNNLQNLQNLKILEISGSLFLENSEKIDNRLFGLKSLVALRIFGGMISGECLQYFKNLQSLILYDNNYVTNDNLNALQNLTELKLNCCNNINCFKNLTKLKSLQYYYITKNNTYLEKDDDNDYYFKEEIKEENFLQNLTNLTNLEVSGDLLKDEYFKNLINLKSLKIKGKVNNKLTGKIFKYLPNLELFKGNLIIEGKYLKYLSLLSKLTFKEIKEPIEINEIKILQKIKEIKLKNVKEIKHEYLKELTNLVVFTTKNVKNNIDFTNSFLNLKRLRKLSIFNNSFIKDNDLKGLQNLTFLELNNCENITGECFLNLQQLKKLYLTEIKVGDEYLNNLIHLKIFHAKKCNNLIYGKFLLKMTELQEFAIKEYEQIRNEELNKLKNIILLNENITLQEATEQMKMEKHQKLFGKSFNLWK